jgi:hypothetical protein
MACEALRHGSEPGRRVATPPQQPCSARACAALSAHAKCVGLPCHSHARGAGPPPLRPTCRHARGETHGGERHAVAVADCVKAGGARGQKGRSAVIGAGLQRQEQEQGIAAWGAAPGNPPKPPPKLLCGTNGLGLRRGRRRSGIGFVRALCNCSSVASCCARLLAGHGIVFQPAGRVESGMTCDCGRAPRLQMHGGEQRGPHDCRCTEVSSRPCRHRT